MPLKLNLLRFLDNNSNTSFFLNLLVILIMMPSASMAWESKYYNPNPESDDVILPMPCDGKMAFRKVSVPGSKSMDDYPINLGGADEEW